MRDEYFQISTDLKKNHLTEELLIKRLQITSQNVVNFLAEAITESSGFKTSACIKYFIPYAEDLGKESDIHDRKYINYELRTLCRSANSHPDRFTYDSIQKTSENTALKRIMFENWDYFAVTDLFRFEKDYNEEYLNSNPNWQKYYRSTIVAPIRIRSDIIDITTEKDKYNILGFICVDSEYNQTFQDNELRDYVELVESFADIMYQYFDRFLYYSNKI